MLAGGQDTVIVYASGSLAIVQSYARRASSRHRCTSAKLVDCREKKTDNNTSKKYLSPVCSPPVRNAAWVGN